MELWISLEHHEVVVCGLFGRPQVAEEVRTPRAPGHDLAAELERLVSGEPGRVRFAALGTPLRLLGVGGGEVDERPAAGLATCDQRFADVDRAGEPIGWRTVERVDQEVVPGVLKDGWRGMAAVCRARNQVIKDRGATSPPGALGEPA